MEKTCFKCKKLFPLSAFYRHSGMKDGYLNKCKECNKADVRLNREKNIDYYKEYDKIRANTPKRLKQRALYAKTPNGIKIANRARIKWNQNNVIKRHAANLITNAVRDKKIIKPDNCSECNKKGRIEGHHDDYAYPMKVRWLCSKCHRHWHKHNETKNG